jgi:hypothetical protein
MTRRRLALLVGTSMAAAALAPASAPGATTIGANDNGGSHCPAGWLAWQDTSTGPSYVVPAPGGVITSWTYRGGANPDQIKFKVLRPIAQLTWTVVGESAVTTMVPNTLNTFPIRVPVEPGDTIGLRTFAADSACLQSGLADEDHVWLCESCTDPGPGVTVSVNGAESNERVNVSAQVEPDCDQDGFGDESQDPELPLGDACGKGTRTVALDANKNRVKKKKKVRLSGQVESAAQVCNAGQTIELQRKRPKQDEFTTVDQLQTDAQGAFSLKKKLKKTFEFRAQVVETAACGAAFSNSEKVKVRKRK